MNFSILIRLHNEPLESLYEAKFIILIVLSCSLIIRLVCLFVICPKIRAAYNITDEKNPKYTVRSVLESTEALVKFGAKKSV